MSGFRRPVVLVVPGQQCPARRTNSSSGDYGAATASGHSGAATASGEKTAAMASGKDGRARGIIGTALFLTERDADWNIVNVAAVIVDGKKILADTYYTLRAGKVVAA